jgi:putative membrane protein
MDRQPDQNTEEVGSEPDPRFTFANERTFLAWNRTALALIVGGLAVVQFMKVGFSGAELLVAMPLILLGAGMSIASYRLWQQNERALRLKGPLPPSMLPRLLVCAIVLIGVVATGLAIVQIAKH